MDKDNKFIPSEEEVKEYIDLIILWLMNYGKLEKQEAINRLIQANMPGESIDKIPSIFFHEEPYYWAMELLFGFGANWYKDENLWPIPLAYRLLEEKYISGELVISGIAIEDFFA